MNLKSALREHILTNRTDLAMHSLPRYRLQYRWTRPEIHVVRVLRRAEFLKKVARANALAWPVYFLYRWGYQRLSSRSGLTLPLGVFAEGLSLAHIGSMTVNRNAKVGRNCRLHPGLTIGATRGNAPTIGNDVFIGPNVVIVGGIHIGDRSHIGPGAIVTVNIPPDTLVLAQPPQQKSRNRPTWQSERTTGNYSD
jgi:serine O-acetyltransferase